MGDWYIIMPAAPWGGRTAVFGPYPGELSARAEFARLAASSLVPECAPKLVQVVEDAATAAGEGNGNG